MTLRSTASASSASHPASKRPCWQPFPTSSGLPSQQSSPSRNGLPALRSSPNSLAIVDNDYLNGRDDSHGRCPADGSALTMPWALDLPGPAEWSVQIVDIDTGAVLAARDEESLLARVPVSASFIIELAHRGRRLSTMRNSSTVTPSNQWLIPRLWQRLCVDRLPAARRGPPSSAPSATTGPRMSLSTAG